MSKLKKNSSINQIHNTTILVKDTDICKDICEITYNILSDKTNKEKNKETILNSFKSKYIHDNNSETLQYGRVWFLVKKTNEPPNTLTEEQKEHYEILQVAEAIDFGSKPKKGFFYEIDSHINEIFENINNNIYSGFARELKKNESLIFYEVNIESYLKKYAPTNYKEIIYKMACGYFAEASIAYFTQAREWGFCNSGMDKRALYYIYENTENGEIDKQKQK